MNTSQAIALSGLFAATLIAPSLTAQTTYDWSGSGDSNTSWSNPALWSPSGTPGSADSIYQTKTSASNNFTRVNGDREVVAYTYAASGSFGIFSNTGGGSSTLTVGSFTTEAGAGVLTVRNSSGFLSLGIGNLSLSATETRFGDFNSTTNTLTSLAVSGSTALSGSALLSLDVTSANLGAVTWQGASTAKINLNNAGITSPGTQVARVVSVSSLSGGGSGAKVGATSGSSNDRVATLRITGNTGTATYAGQLVNNIGANAQGTLNVEKTGGGTQILAGNNTYTGTTVITGGKLVVNGTHTGAGAYTVSNSGTLAGNGTITTINGNIVVGADGHLSAGDNGVGSLTFSLGTGKLDLTQAGNGALGFNLGSNLTGNQILLTSGVIDIGSGNIDLNSISLVTATGFGTGSYTLLSSTESIVGTLGPDLTGILGGYEATLSLSGDNRSIVLNVGAAAIPEPNSAVLSASVAVLLCTLVMRRSRN